jgi:hypothetical protein
MEVPFTLTNADFINAVLKACHPCATATKTMSDTGILLVQEYAVMDWKNTQPEVDIVEWDPDCVNAQSPNIDNKGVLLLVPSTQPVHKMMHSDNSTKESPKTKKSCAYRVRFVDSLLLQYSTRIGHKFVTTLQNIAANNSNMFCRFVLTFNNLPPNTRAQEGNLNFATAFKKLFHANEEHCIICMPDHTHTDTAVPSVRSTQQQNEMIRRPRDWEEAVEFARNTVPTRSRKNTRSRTASKRHIFDLTVIAAIHKAVQEEDEHDDTTTVGDTNCGTCDR